jgi:hypothetical protein
MTVYRVHWLKAKSRRDRWREEHILLASEMEWTELFFRHRASRWKFLAAESSGIASSTIRTSDSEQLQDPNISHKGKSEGHLCYALKLESMWDRLAQQAVAHFSAVKAVREPQQRTRVSSFTSSSSELSQ